MEKNIFEEMKAKLDGILPEGYSTSFGYEYVKGPDGEYRPSSTIDCVRVIVAKDEDIVAVICTMEQTHIFMDFLWVFKNSRTFSDSDDPFRCSNPDCSLCGEED